MNFDGKRVLITGGGRGIGRATALAFAERGAQVAITYRVNEAAASETLQLLPGGPHLMLPADMQQTEDLSNLIARMVMEWQGIDILVNNAGVGEAHPVLDTDFATWQAAWEKTLAVNLLGPAHLSYLAAQQMKQQGGGCIVNVSSRGAFRGEPQMPAYGASKAGLNAMSQSLAQALAPHGIFVGVVAPGFVETDMARAILDSPQGEAIRAQSPLGRVAQPEEVAWAVLFLASEKAKFSTGTIIDVNGASYLRS